MTAAVISERNRAVPGQPPTFRGAHDGLDEQLNKINLLDWHVCATCAVACRTFVKLHDVQLLRPLWDKYRESG